MLEWIKLLSMQTLLNKENQLMEQAEDMISKATYLQAKSDEEKENEMERVSQIDKDDTKRRGSFIGKHSLCVCCGGETFSYFPLLTHAFNPPLRPR